VASRAALRGPGRRSGLIIAAVVLTACGASPTATARTTPTTPTTPTTGTSPAAPLPTTSPTTTTPLPPTTVPGGLRAGPGARSTYEVEAQPVPGSCRYRYVGPDPLPDPGCTPGAVDPGVSQADIATTICATGWTATVRPPEDVTGPEKVASAGAYGYQGSLATAEYDHLVPLELGGDPNDPANLWLEPNDLAGATSFHNSKDDVEGALRRLVCAGRLPLATAQEAIAADWVTAGQQYRT